MELARASERVSTDDLAERFDVSPQTIRKDLNELCERGVLARVHGGAVIARGGTENLEYERRRGMASSEKERIGLAAANMVPQRASLFLNIGTTTEAVARALTGHQSLLVVTNNINVASTLCVRPEHEVVIAGGAVRASDGGIVGEATVDFINQFKVDYAIIGASAIDADGALLDYDYREVRVAQAIMKNARTVVLAADSSKLNRIAPVRIGHLSQVDIFITDRLPSPALRRLCDQNDVLLHETDAQGEDTDVLTAAPTAEAVGSR